MYSEWNSPSHTHTFMMWEESEKPEEGGGARLVGEAGGLGVIWAAMQWNEMMENFTHAK